MIVNMYAFVEANVNYAKLECSWIIKEVIDVWDTRCNRNDIMIS